MRIFLSTVALSSKAEFCDCVDVLSIGRILCRVDGMFFEGSLRGTQLQDVRLQDNAAEYSEAFS